MPRVFSPWALTGPTRCALKVGENFSGGIKARSWNADPPEIFKIFISLFQISLLFFRRNKRNIVNILPGGLLPALRMKPTGMPKNGPVGRMDFRFTLPEQDPTTCEAWRVKFNEHLMELLKKWIYQLEHSRPMEHEDGPNIHFQGTISLKTKIRPKQLARSLNKVFPGIRMERASTNGLLALSKYCMKKEGRLDGPWADKPLYNPEEDCWDESKWPQWMTDVTKMLRTEKADRRIHWHVDYKGSSGKTEWAKMLEYEGQACYLGYEKNDGVKYMVCEAGQQPAYIFDLTRTKPKDMALEDLYAELEVIKGGLVKTSKWKGGRLLAPKPHVIVLANFKPMSSRLSKDRWNIIDITDPEWFNSDDGKKFVEETNWRVKVAEAKALIKKDKEMKLIKKAQAIREANMDKEVARQSVFATMDTD